jgi:hypothetical protein
MATVDALLPALGWWVDDRFQFFEYIAEVGDASFALHNLYNCAYFAVVFIKYR